MAVIGPGGKPYRKKRKKPKRQQAVDVNRQRASGYAPPKPRPPQKAAHLRPEYVSPSVYKDLDPDYTPVVVNNVRTLTEAFEVKEGKRPTATQAYQMLSVIGDEELGAGDWGAFLAPAIASNSKSAELMRYANDYYRETGYFPNAAHMMTIMQSDGKVNFGDMATPRNDVVLADVLFNGALKNARTKERERAKKSSYRFSAQDIMKMPGGPKTLAGAMKARQLANRPMFTLGKTWDAEDPDERINQKDLDRINKARDWYGMTSLKRKINKNIEDREQRENPTGLMMNGDGTPNNEAAKLIAQISGNDAVLGLDTFVGLKNKSFQREKLNRDVQLRVDAFGKRLMDTFPDMHGPGKDGHFVWNANYDQYANMFLFQANLPAALMRNDFPDGSPEWKRVNQQRKLAVANISVATSGQIELGDDLREWMIRARFLGPSDSPEHFSEILDEYLFENCFLGTIVEPGTGLGAAMVEYVNRYGGGRVESLPLKYREAYNDMEKQARIARRDSRIANGDNPLDVSFGMYFDEEVKKLEMYNRLEYEAAMDPANQKLRGRPTDTDGVEEWVMKAIDEEKPPVVVGRGGGPVIDPRDPLSDSQMFYHTTVRPMVAGIADIALNAPYRWVQRIYMTAALMSAYSNAPDRHVHTSYGTPYGAFFGKVGDIAQERYGDDATITGAATRGTSLASATKPSNFTIPMDPSAYSWSNINKAWDEANKAVSESESDAYMRYEFKQIGLDPDEHAGMLFFASLSHSLAFDVLGDAAIGGAVKGGTRIAARIARATMKPRLLKRVEAAQDALAAKKYTAIQSELADWQKRLDDATLAMSDSNVMDSGWLALQRERDLAAGNVEYLMKSLEEATPRYQRPLPEGPVDDATARRAQKLIPVDIEDTIYGPDELAAIRVSDTYADAHLLERPLWYDTFAENLSNVTIDSARVQFLFGLKERHVPNGVVDGVSNKAEYDRLLRVIGESRDAEEIERAMNKLRTSFLLKLDAGGLALGKLHHWNRIVHGESFGKITMTMPEGTFIENGLDEVEEHLHEVWTLVNGGEGAGHSTRAMDRMWYYLQELRNVGTKIDEAGNRVSANLSEADKRTRRLQIWEASQEEIVQRLKSRKPTKAVVNSLVRFAKMNGMKVDKAMIDAVSESEWAAYKAFQVIKNHKHVRIPIVSRKYTDLSDTRWYDSIQSDAPFVLGSQKGTGQTTAHLHMRFNLQDLSHFQRGKSFSQMAFNTNLGGWLPSWMGAVNASKTLAVASMSFPLSALFIDEFWRFIPELLGGRVSMRAAVRGYGRKELEAVGNRLSEASRKMVIADASGDKAAISIAKRELEKAQRDFLDMSEYHRSLAKGKRLAANDGGMDLMQQNNPQYIPVLPGQKNYHRYLSHLVRQYQDDLIFREFLSFREQLSIQTFDAKLKRALASGLPEKEATDLARKAADEFVDRIDPVEFKALFRQYVIDKLINNSDEGTLASLESAGLRHNLKSTGRLTDDMLESVDDVFRRQEEYLRATQEVDNARIAIRQERLQALDELKAWNEHPHVVPESEGFPVSQRYSSEVVKEAFADELALIPRSLRPRGSAIDKALREFRDRRSPLAWNRLKREIQSALTSQRDDLKKRIDEVSGGKSVVPTEDTAKVKRLKTRLDKVKVSIRQLEETDPEDVAKLERLLKDEEAAQAQINQLQAIIDSVDQPAAPTIDKAAIEKDLKAARAELKKLDDGAAKTAPDSQKFKWLDEFSVRAGDEEQGWSHLHIEEGKDVWDWVIEGNALGWGVYEGRPGSRLNAARGFKYYKSKGEAKKALEDAISSEMRATPQTATDEVKAADVASKAIKDKEFVPGESLKDGDSTLDAAKKWAAKNEVLDKTRPYYVYREADGRLTVTAVKRDGEPDLNDGHVTFSRKTPDATPGPAAASHDKLNRASLEKKIASLEKQLEEGTAAPTAAAPKKTKLTKRGGAEQFKEEGVWDVHLPDGRVVGMYRDPASRNWYAVDIDGVFYEQANHEAGLISVGYKDEAVKKLEGGFDPYRGTRAEYKAPTISLDGVKARAEKLDEQLTSIRQEMEEMLAAKNDRDGKLLAARSKADELQQKIDAANRTPVDDGVSYEEMAAYIRDEGARSADEQRKARLAFEETPDDRGLLDAWNAAQEHRKEVLAKIREYENSYTYMSAKRDELNKRIWSIGPRKAPETPPARRIYVMPERVTTRGRAREAARLSWSQLQKDPQGSLAILGRMKGRMPTTEDAIRDAASKETQQQILDAVNEARLRRYGLLTDDETVDSPIESYREIRRRLDELRQQRKVKEEELEALGNFPRHQFLNDRGDEWLDETIDRYMIVHGQPELLDAIRNQRNLKKWEVDEIRMRLGDKYGRTESGAPVRDLPTAYGVKNTGTSWFSSPGSAPGNIPIVSRLAELTAYRLLNTMGNATRKVAFYGNFNVELRKLMDAGYTIEDAAEAAMWRAKDYADSVMYKPGMTALESDLAGYMYFLPAYRQGSIYWGKQFLKHPLVYSHLASIGKEDFPVQYLGDYGMAVPLPLFMTGNVGEMAVPGLTAPLLFPIRAANAFTGWEYINVSPNDTTTTSDDNMKWVYTGDTKWDWLHENKFLSPMTGFADKSASPTSWIDDVVYGLWGVVGPLEADGYSGRLLSSLAIALRKDPIVRERASLNIMMEQISRGHAPDTDLFEARIKGSPGWYNMIAHFAENPEAVLGMLTRQFFFRKLLYSPRSIGEIEPVKIDGEPGNLWNYVGMFRDENARTLAEAEWEYIEASGNPALQAQLLKKYPRLAATKKFWKMTAEEKQDFLLKEKNHHLIPYVNGKNMYGGGGHLSEWEFHVLRERGIIRRKENADFIRDANILHATSNFTKQYLIIEKKRDKDLKAANKYVQNLINKSDWPEYTKMRRRRDWEGYLRGHWGEETVSKDISKDPDEVPPPWLGTLVRQFGERGDYNKPSLWDPGAIRRNFQENEEAMREDKSAPQSGAYKTIEDFYDEDALKRWGVEDGGIGDHNRITKAFNDMLLPEDRKEFALNRSMSQGYIKERTKEERERRERSIIKVISKDTWEQSSANDIINACPGIITPGSPNYIGSKEDIDDYMTAADNAFGRKKDAYDSSGNRVNPDTDSDKAKKAQEEYNKEMERLGKTRVGMFFQRGVAYRILQSSLADPGHGRRLNKEFISSVVKAAGNDGDIGEALEDLPVAGYKDQKKNVSSHAWASIMILAEKEKRKVDNERKYRPDDENIGNVERKAGERLTRLVDSWMKRPLSSRFKKEWVKYNGYSILTSYIGGDY